MYQQEDSSVIAIVPVFIGCCFFTKKPIFVFASKTRGLFTRHGSVPTSSFVASPCFCRDAEKQACYRPEGWRMREEEREEEGVLRDEQAEERRRALEYIHRLTLVEQMESRA